MDNRIFLKKGIIFFFLCGLIMAFSGCVQVLQSNREAPDAFSPDLKSNEYSKEIKRLENVIKSNHNRAESINAHYQLASLYSSYKNPKKDYKKALEQLNIYVSLDSKAAKRYDVMNFMSLLREINKLSGDLAVSNRKNSQLKLTIKRLQTLDLQVEQKRRSYR